MFWQILMVFVDNLNKEIWPILSGEESTSFGYNFRTTDLQFDQQLNSFFDGTSVAGIAMTTGPTRITSEFILWGDESNGAMLSGEVTGISTLNELISSIEGESNKGTFNSFTITDSGNDILTIKTSEINTSISSGMHTIELYGDLPNGILTLLGMFSSLVNAEITGDTGTNLTPVDRDNIINFLNDFGVETSLVTEADISNLSNLSSFFEKLDTAEITGDTGTNLTTVDRDNIINF